MKTRFSFLLIPDIGDAVPSLLTYPEMAVACATGRAVAFLTMQTKQRTVQREELAVLREAAPTVIEVVVIDAATKEAVHHAIMERGACQ